MWSQRLARSLCIVLLLKPLPNCYGRTFIVDQQNRPLLPLTLEIIKGHAPVGQEFVPTRSTVEQVDLIGVGFEVMNQPPFTADMYVNIRANTIGGPILGTSETIAVPGGQTTNHLSFPFSSPVAVVPGSRYVMEFGFNNPSGQLHLSTSNFSQRNSYPAGRPIYNGNATTSIGDFWFREGFFEELPSQQDFVNQLSTGNYMTIRDIGMDIGCNNDEPLLFYDYPVEITAQSPSAGKVLGKIGIGVASVGLGTFLGFLLGGTEGAAAGFAASGSAAARYLNKWNGVGVEARGADIALRHDAQIFERIVLPGTGDILPAIISAVSSPENIEATYSIPGFRPGSSISFLKESVIPGTVISSHDPFDLPIPGTEFNAFLLQANDIAALGFLITNNLAERQLIGTDRAKVEFDNVFPGIPDGTMLEVTSTFLAATSAVPAEFLGLGCSVPVAGDYNNNGSVDQADLDLVLLNWGKAFDTLPAKWINERPTSGIVSQAQLDGVLLHWGNSGALGAGGAVPEPSTVVLLLIAAGLGLGLFRHCRITKEHK